MGPTDAAAERRWRAPTGRDGDPVWYTRRFEMALYLVAGLSYVVLGVFHKFILNWVVGPVWLVAIVWSVPAIVERARSRRAT